MTTLFQTCALSLSLSLSLSCRFFFSFSPISDRIPLNHTADNVNKRRRIAGNTLMPKKTIDDVGLTAHWWCIGRPKTITKTGAIESRRRDKMAAVSYLCPTTVLFAGSFIFSTFLYFIYDDRSEISSVSKWVSAENQRPTHTQIHTNTHTATRL